MRILKKKSLFSSLSLFGWILTKIGREKEISAFFMLTPRFILITEII